MKRSPMPRRRSPLANSRALTRSTRLRAKRRTVTAEEKAARAAVRARSGGICELCGRRPAASFHHRWKQGQGGPWSASNGLDLCGSGTTGCHGHVEHNPSAAKAQGWWVQPWQNPATVPVWIAGRGLVYLNDEGTFTQAEAA